MNGKVYGRDMEVVQRLKPEPMTPEELAAQEEMDEVDFEIFNHKMNMIAMEGKETTMKLGASSGMRWGDVAFGVYTAQGDLAVVATGIWFHAVLGQIPVKYIVKHWIHEPSVGVKEGDSFFWNDPFYGGVHGADMGLCVPVYYEGNLVCFTGAVVHTGESGGSEPGGLVGSARSKYDEGMLVPPIKVGENYTLKEDLLNMFAAMNRDPRTMILDIKARLAACRIAQRRIIELIDQKGLAFFLGALRRILAVTAEAAKKKVRLLNDGVFRQPRFMDTVGPEPALTKIDITLTKKDDKIKFTFKDTTPMLQDKPLNTFFQGIVGLAMVYFCGWFFHDLPANNGLLETLEWEFPENSIINAQGDVSTSVSPFTQTCFAHGMFLAGARITYSLDPLRAVAAWYQGFGVPIYGGMNQWNEPMADITPEINATGAGARPDMDGVDGAGAYFATMSDCSDKDAGIDPSRVEAGFFANALASRLFGDSTIGQNVFWEVGINRIPVVNVENACTSGSTAFYLAYNMVASGQADVVMVAGGEKMCVPEFGLINSGETELDTRLGLVAPASFALRAVRHMAEFGTTPEQLAQVAAKNRSHASHNPFAQFRNPLTISEVLESPMIVDPLTRFQCCPIADGAAAAVVCSPTLAERIGRAVNVEAAILCTGSYENPQDLARWETDLRCVHLAYEKSGIGPEDLDVIECHDAFTISEILHYESLGLCEAGIL